MSQKLIKELEGELGTDAVMSGAGYARAGTTPVGVALPKDIEQLRAILSIASENNVSLWVLPNSAANGGIAGPATDKDILVIDQSRMNSIVEVNAKGAYALVEPGVSYMQLSGYLEENNTGLWVDCDRNGLNSVSGSVSAREFGYTAYGDHTMMQCGMEIMLADGELVRLGMGAMPKSNTWQLAKYAYGPYLDGLFTQSGLGIVTKMGVWLMPAPPAYQPFAVTLKGDSDLAQSVEILRSFKVNVIIPNTVVISNTVLDAAPFASRDDFADGMEVDTGRLAAWHGLGQWTLYGALYNTPPNVDVLWPMVRGAFAGIEGATALDLKTQAANPVLSGREAMMRGRPSKEFNNLGNWSGDAYLYAGFVSPIDGRQVLNVNKLAGDTVRAAGFDYLTEYAVGWRSIIQRVYLPYPRASEARAAACLETLIEAMAQRGFGVSHVSAGYLDKALAGYDNAGMAELRGRLKQALDPGGLFAA